MAKQIFFVMSCDSWKSIDSMRLQFIGTSQKKLKMFVSKEIERGYMDYGIGSREEQARSFRHDWEYASGDCINNRLDYGYINYCYDNDPESL